MKHREEATWVIRIEATAEFDASYDGELDGFAWRDRQFRELRERAAQAVLRALAATPGWRVRTGNRGLSVSDELLIHVDVDVDSEAHGAGS